MARKSSRSSKGTKASTFVEETPLEDVEVAFSGEDESDLDGLPAKVVREMVVVPTDWTVGTLIDQLRLKNIDLTPRFQRRDAWTLAKKSRFIESLFLRLPVPQLVLAETRPGSYAIIDGKQRLLSLAQFALEGFSDQPLVLKDIKIRPELSSKSFAEIRGSGKLFEDFNVFYNATMRTVVVRNWRDERLLYLLFLRLNQNSVSLSPQELRGALHPGPFTDFAEEWSGKSTGLSLIFPNQPDFRMRDVEITVRLFAFRCFAASYSGNMKAFLDSTSSQLNKNWKAREVEIEAHASEFNLAFSAAAEIFENEPFRKFIPEKKRYERRINRAVLDIMIYFLTDEPVRKAALKNKSKVKSAFEKLCESDSDFISAIETTTKSLRSTYIRFAKWQTALTKIIKKPVHMPDLRKVD